MLADGVSKYMQGQNNLGILCTRLKVYKSNGSKLSELSLRAKTFVNSHKISYQFYFEI